MEALGEKAVARHFVALCQPLNPLGPHHDLLMSNVFAQSEALAFGMTRDEVGAEGTPDWKRN
jgi:glucose-6-phosphate isomerase